jgi:adenine-specific DNA-methyltransferase
LEKINKLKMHSNTLADDNFRVLEKIFPNAVTETIKGYDTDGTPVIERVIDVDILAQEINNRIISNKEERYQFTWPDKKKSILLANTPVSATLRPVRDESTDFDNTKNIYIEGDNIDTLKLLRETYLNRVKMIYIDPPYNTGNDFIYKDDFSIDVKVFLRKDGQFDQIGNQLTTNSDSNGRFHTDWLNMIYPRLRISRDLLAEDGVIFISIDDNEVKNIRSVCDEIFGEVNFVAQLPWQSRQSIQNDTDISKSHEYIVVYAKNRRSENRRLKESNAKQWFDEKSFVCLPIPLEKDNFSNVDSDPRGLWKADPFDAPNIRPNLTFPIINPKTGEEHWPPKGRCWRTDKLNYEKLLSDNRIVFGKSGNTKPQLKVFYEEKKHFGSIDNTWWSAEKCGTSTQGTKELIELFDGFNPFDTPKPVKLIYRMLKLVSLPQNNDIILDFFSGSATTAHAVMKLNAEDGGNRKFIMVQLPEICEPESEAAKAGYSNICEIGKERIRRAGKKIKEEAGLMAENLDVGFRVLKLDSSNMKDVYYTPEEYAQMNFNLDGFMDNIKPDRTDEDLLFQVMLDLGVPLSAKIKKEGDLFYVDENYLVACFGEVDSAIITDIARKKPYYAVFRDSSFLSDSALVNVDQIFNTYSPQTIRRVL